VIDWKAQHENETFNRGGTFQKKVLFFCRYPTNKWTLIRWFVFCEVVEQIVYIELMKQRLAIQHKNAIPTSTNQPFEILFKIRLKA